MQKKYSQNKKNALKKLKEIKQYDHTVFAKEKPFSHLIYDSNNNKKHMITNEVNFLTKNYYTFPPEPAKNKKLFLIKKFIFKLLFKYTFRQVIFNNHLVNLLNIVLETINQNTESINQNTESINQNTESINQNTESINQNTKQITRAFELILELNNNVAALHEMNEILLSKIYKNKNLTSNFRFFSQFGEDKWIVENINLPKRGVFIDVGAADGVTFSNTYYFEKNGWSGICIEPDTRNFNKAKLFRKKVLNLAVSNKEGKVKFYESGISPDLSGLNIDVNQHNANIKVIQAKKLETVLSEEKIGKIDLLSIDTEGSEIEVWQSFDYKKHKPVIVIIEYMTMGKENQKIKQLFNALPYKLVHQTPANLIYKLEKS